MTDVESECSASAKLLKPRPQSCSETVIADGCDRHWRLVLEDRVVLGAAAAMQSMSVAATVPGGQSMEVCCARLLYVNQRPLLILLMVRCARHTCWCGAGECKWSNDGGHGASWNQARPEFRVRAAPTF